jgi:hypothetical protein
MGAGIPKTKLEGTEAGAVTGSEVNQREYYKYLSDQQKGYENQTVGALIDLLMKIGQVKPDVDYKITWVSGFELDITTENTAKLADAQAAASELKYMLIDEVRAKRNLKTLSEVSGGKLDGQVLAPQPSPGGFGTGPKTMSADELLEETPQRTLLDFILNRGQGDVRHPRGPADIEKSLAGGLASLVRNYSNGLMSKDDALAKGQGLISSHYERVVDASKKQLNRHRSIRKNIQTLPPEAVKRLEARRSQAVADFLKVLDDVKH